MTQTPAAPATITVWQPTTAAATVAAKEAATQEHGQQPQQQAENPSAESNKQSL